MIMFYQNCFSMLIDSFLLYPRQVQIIYFKYIYLKVASQFWHRRFFISFRAGLRNMKWHDLIKQITMFLNIDHISKRHRKLEEILVSVFLSISNGFLYVGFSEITSRIAFNILSENFPVSPEGLGFFLKFLLQLLLGFFLSEILLRFL